MHQALTRDLYMHFSPHKITPGGNYVYLHFTGEETEMWSFMLHNLEVVELGYKLKRGKGPRYNLLTIVFYFLYH